VLLLVHFSAPAAAPHLLRLRALLTPAMLPPPLPVLQGSVEGQGQEEEEEAVWG
jgi:hypothetical protein